MENKIVSEIISLNIGIDLGGTKLMIISEDTLGVTHSSKTPTGKKFTLDQFKKDLEDFLQKTYGTCPYRVRSIGIAVCGLCDTDKTMVTANIPALVGWNPVQALKSWLKCDIVTVMNDAKAALIAAQHNYVTIGEYKDQNIVVIVVGTGIGQSAMVDGKIIEGSFGWAGNLALIPILKENGVHASLASLACGRALVEKIHPIKPEEAQQMLKNLYETKKPTEEYTPEEKKVFSILSEAAMALGLGISYLLHILNPSLVVMAGGVLHFEGFYEAVIKGVAKYTEKLDRLYKECNFVKSQFIDELVAMGTLLVAKESF